MGFDFTFTPVEAQIVYAFLASVVVPPAVSFIKRGDWNRNVKVALSVLVALLMAALSQYMAGNLNGGSFVVAAIGVLVASQTLYKAYFKDTRLNAKLENIGS